MSICESFYCVWRIFTWYNSFSHPPLSWNISYCEMMVTVKCNNYSTCFCFVRREKNVADGGKGIQHGVKSWFFICEYTFYDTITIFLYKELKLWNTFSSCCVCFSLTRSPRKFNYRYFCIINLHCNCSTGTQRRTKKH